MTRAVSAFVCYASTDADFREALRQDLEKQEVTVHGDWRLKAGPEYPDQLRSLIQQSDVFLFVITSHSIASKYCRWELATAVRQNKRVQTIRLEPRASIVLQATEWPEWCEPSEVTSFPPDNVLNAAIALPQWLAANDPLFSEKLDVAVRTDLRLAESHTDLLVASEKWIRNQRDSGLLLRGRELRRASEWLAEVDGRGPVLLPRATDGQRSFIEASLKGVRVRGIWTAAAITVFFCIGGLGLWAWSTRQINHKQLEDAQTAAEYERDQQESSRLADQAMSTLLQNPDRARELAGSAVALAEKIHSGTALTQARDSFIQAAVFVGAYQIHDAFAGRIRFELLGPYDSFVAIEEGTPNDLVSVWQPCGREYKQDGVISGSGQFVAIAVSPATGRLAVAGPGSSVRLFDARPTGSACGDSGDLKIVRALPLLQEFPTPAGAQPVAVDISRDGNLVAAGFNNGQACIWAAGTRLNECTPVDDDRPVVVRITSEAQHLVVGVQRKNGEAVGSVWSIYPSLVHQFGSDTPQTALTTVAVNIPADLMLMGFQTRVRTAMGQPLPPDVGELTHASQFAELTDQLRQLLTDHKQGITAADFSPDGHYLFTASRDRTVKVWNMQKSKWAAVCSGLVCPLVTLHGEPDEIVAMSFSADGRTIATFTREGWMILRRIDPQVFDGPPSDVVARLKKEQQTPPPKH